MFTRRFLLIALTAFSAFATSAITPPNIVIIFTDDQGYGDVGCFGAEGYETPHLDKMAEEGMRFTDFYVAAPVCTPSRAALLTGCYPKRVGLAHRVLFPFSEHGLNPDEVTIAEMLKEEGYATACIGKWHLGHTPNLLPNAQGFDYYFGFPYSTDMDLANYKSRGFQAPPIPLYRNSAVVEESPDQHYLTKRYTEEAVDFIKGHQNVPFFLYLPHAMPHVPIYASEDFEGKTEHGLYGDVISEIDWSVGEVLKTLKDCGIDENTLVIFTSDNGAQLWTWRGMDYQTGKNEPLRGMKNTTWDGGQRVPCIMRWPAGIPAGKECSEMTLSMDIMPTIAALTYAQMPLDRIIDGKDIGSLLRGEAGAKTPHEAFYFYRDDRLQAVRSGDWKLHVFRPDDKKFPEKAPLLYNLRDDIGETTNIYDQHPEIVAKLMALADKAREDMGDAVTGAEGKNVRPVGQAELY